MKPPGNSGIINVTPHGETRWTPIQDTANFRPMGCYTALLGFFTDYSSRMFISQFPANKITEIDLEVCEKSEILSTILRFIYCFYYNL